MVRAESIAGLAAAAISGNAERVGRAIETLIAEESKNGHRSAAMRLQQLLEAEHDTHAAAVTNRRFERDDRPSWAQRGSYTREATRRLRDLELDQAAEHAAKRVIQEQQNARVLRAAGIEPRHRVLLVGAPGTGKTSLAEAFASELAVPYEVILYESVVGSYLGETSARLHELFQRVSAEPCVLFLDEFDTLAKERGDEHDTGEVKRVVSTLLLQLDALPPHVLLVAATNHPELLDRAAWRRFQVVIELPLPDADRRREYAKRVATRVGLKSPGRLEREAAEENGASFADIENLVLDRRREELLGPVG
ncbi:SpoVK/Ycf46/Vps4 family AAA+-type ATPase [Leifsonia sp. EB41]|uniref:AAA family ATPase n=1 Tax=Leifsonia sp. EB41 TaxID=3156260 RepID=UPI0035186488